jgi:hypothetical protein
MTHPFKAKKAMQLSMEARAEAELKIKDPDLDGDYAGGQVDAFRHVFWMSYLTVNIGGPAAVSLGRAYERSNKIDFKKKLLEEGYLPDFVTSQMDLQNNDVGVNLGKQFPDAGKTDLIEQAKQCILKGEAFIVKKNKKGEFLTSQNRIIPKDEYLGKWFTSKVLVPSNFKRPD